MARVRLEEDVEAEPPAMQEQVPVVDEERQPRAEHDQEHPRGRGREPKQDQGQPRVVEPGRGARGGRGG